MIQRKNWQKSQDKTLRIGCVFSIISSFFILAMVYPIPIWQRLFLLASVNLLVLLISAMLHRKNANTIEKVFYVEINKATQIVENILKAKNMPFRKQRLDKKVQFNLDKEEVEVILSPYIPNRRGFINWPKGVASLVKIRPIDIENELLIHSLKGKFDDEFSPKGL